MAFEYDLMVINKSGITIRIGVDTLRVMGRATQGVRIIRLKDEDKIASVAKVSKWEAQEDEVLDDEGNVIETTEEVEGETAVEETNESTDNEDQSEDTDNNKNENTNENN